MIEVCALAKRYGGRRSSQANRVFVVTECDAICGDELHVRIRETPVACDDEMPSGAQVLRLG